MRGLTGIRETSIKVNARDSNGYQSDLGRALSRPEFSHQDVSRKTFYYYKSYQQPTMVSAISFCLLVNLCVAHHSLNRCVGIGDRCTDTARHNADPTAGLRHLSSVQQYRPASVSVIENV